MQSIESQIFANAEKFPEHPAITNALTGSVISYGELAESILSCARRFRFLGFKKGERIIIAASKDPDFVSVYFGAHCAGLIAVPIDPETNSERLERIEALASPVMAVGSLRHSPRCQQISFGEFCKIELSEPLIPVFNQDEIADLMFTTGTTGLPKGVALSYLNEVAAARNINEFIGNDSDDTELLALPISHSFGLGRLRCVLKAGGTVVLLGSFASMKRFYAALDNYPITGFGMVPSSWAYLSKMSGDRIGNYAEQLKYIEIGSAPLPPEQKERLIYLLPQTKICMHYGLTEASRSAFTEFHRDKDFLCSAGKATPNCEISIFSSDGKMLGNESEGEVCVRGEHICASYWGMSEEEFRKDFFEDWFRTGDRGYISAEGWLYLSGRDKEMINVGGKKVNPLEVEEVLKKFGGIRDCACVAMPDSVMGEVVRACIVADSEPDWTALKEFLSKSLENYKVPVKFEQVQEIPRTSSGKIQRLKLK